MSALTDLSDEVYEGAPDARVKMPLVNVRMPPYLIRDLKLLAEEEDRPVGQLIRRAVRIYMEEQWKAKQG